MYIYVWSIVMCILSEMRKKKKAFWKKLIWLKQKYQFIGFIFESHKHFDMRENWKQSKKKNTNFPWGIFIFDISKYQQQ